YTLNGTLVIPNTELSEYPVVIFIHGSGPMDRDETVPFTSQNSLCLYPDLYGDTIKIFKEISEYIENRGIATFRYDKRTYTYGASLDIEKIRPYDFITDAVSAVNYIKNQPKIDENNIFIIGHSQGANFLPIIAEQFNVKGLVNLACLARPIDSVYAEQIKYIFKTCGDSIQGETYYDQYMEAFFQIRNNRWNEDIPIDGVYSKFWKDWINITDSSIIRYQENSDNILFLQGTDDINVPPINAERFSNNLSDNVDVILFQGLNHYFSNSTLAQVDNRVLDTISEWISRKLLINDNIKHHYSSKLLIKYLNDRIEIRTPNNENIINAILFDLNGRQINNFFPRNSLIIQRSGISQKIYVIKIVTKRSIYINKLVL
ncbi:serine aminopeptidase domain-containing protein, partial [Bacteroidota bacterium]